MVAIYLCGHSLLTVIYGARYVAAFGPLAVAATVVFLNVLNAAITCLFNGIGLPGLHRRAVAASAVAMLIAIYPACKLLGIVGGQVAALLAIILSYVLQVMRMRASPGWICFAMGKHLRRRRLYPRGSFSLVLAPSSLAWRRGRWPTSLSARSPVLLPMPCAYQPS